MPPKAAAVLADCPEPIWDEYDSKRLLKTCGIPTVKEKIVASAANAVEAAREVGFPVVLKGLVKGQVHKTESGLVRLGLSSPSEIRAAYADLEKKLKGKGRILLQKQMPAEYELIAGVLRNEQFGPCVMFGLGGIFAELQKDVVFAPAPLSLSTARELIGRISGSKLLHGFRGGKPLDLNLMAGILVNLGNLAAARPDIGQIDVNPLVVYQGKPVAVDATVIRRVANNE
jgi:acetyltransferase